jgi:Ala-tRNA(Pro) deacylase
MARQPRAIPALERLPSSLYLVFRQLQTTKKTPMPATRDDLMAMLARLGIVSSTVDHPPLFTVEQSRALRGEIPGAHTKNLFLKDKKDALFLVTAPEDAVLDLKHIHRLVGASGRVSFGKPELLMDALGVPAGAVTPFAAMNDTSGRVTVVLDSRLVAGPAINCHPLVNTATTTIASSDLLAFLRATGHEPKVVPLSG